MRSIARFNGKDNKVQAYKKHFTVTLSFAINLPFRRVESRRFFRCASISFTFFFLSDLSRSLYFSLFQRLDVLESTCGSCFSERRISLENTREMISLRVDIANKWKTALKSLLSPYLGDSLRLCIVGDSNSVSRRVFPRSAESPMGRKCIPKKRVRNVYHSRLILFRAEILSNKCILLEHQNR